jgi:hypothetical protein
MVGRGTGLIGRAALVALASFICVASAQAEPAPAKKGKEPAAKAQAQVQAPAQAQVPGAEQIVALVRTTLLTLNDAVQTGNFTVLRDVGSRGFQDANSAAKLSQVFSDLIKQRVDLSIVAVRTPEMAEAKIVDAKTNTLNLKGHFPVKPLQIDFEMMFQPERGRWRLFGISVNPVMAADVAPAANAVGAAR